MNRATRMRVAEETVEIVARGAYTPAGGAAVDLRPMLYACLEGTRFYPPERLEEVRREVLSRPGPGHATALEVRS